MKLVLGLLCSLTHQQPEWSFSLASATVAILDAVSSSRGLPSASLLPSSKDFYSESPDLLIEHRQISPPAVKCMQDLLHTAVLDPAVSLICSGAASSPMHTVKYPGATSSPVHGALSTCPGASSSLIHAALVMCSGLPRSAISTPYSPESGAICSQVLRMQNKKLSPTSPPWKSSPLQLVTASATQHVWSDPAMLRGTSDVLEHITCMQGLGVWIILITNITARPPPVLLPIGRKTGGGLAVMFSLAPRRRHHGSCIQSVYTSLLSVGILSPKLSMCVQELKIFVLCQVELCGWRVVQVCDSGKLMAWLICGIRRDSSMCQRSLPRIVAALACSERLERHGSVCGMNSPVCLSGRRRGIESGSIVSASRKPFHWHPDKSHCKLSTRQLLPS